MVFGASGASGLLAGAAPATSALSPSSELSLTLGATPTSSDLTLFVRYWSASGSVSSPTATMASGWDFEDEVLSLWNYAGSTIAFSRASSTSTAVVCADPWTGGDGEAYGGAALAIILRAEGGGPTVVEADGSALAWCLASSSVARVACSLSPSEALSLASLEPVRVASCPAESEGTGIESTQVARVAGAEASSVSRSSAVASFARWAGAVAESVSRSVGSWLSGATRAAVGAALSRALSVFQPSSRSTSRVVVARVTGRVSSPVVSANLPPPPRVSGRIMSPRVSGVLSAPR